MYERNEWSKNENFSLEKIAQDVMNTCQHNTLKSSCCVDTTKIAKGPCGDIKTSCCVDTTKITSGPCGDIKTSCCIDTLRE